VAYLLAAAVVGGGIGIARSILTQESDFIKINKFEKGLRDVPVKHSPAGSKAY